MWEIITLDPKDSFSNIALMLQNTVSSIRLCATLIYYFTGITGLYFYIHNIINWQFIAGLSFYSAVIFLKISYYFKVSLKGALLWNYDLDYLFSKILSF